MIYATSDTHGNFQRFAPEHFPEQAGNGHDCFQSRSPWTAPLKEGATIHRSSRCVASCRKPLAGSR